MEDLPIVPRQGDAYIVSANESSSSGGKPQIPKNWWKWVLGSVGGVLVISAIVSTVLFIKQTTDQVTRAVDRQARLMRTLTEESFEPSETPASSHTFNAIAQVQAGYENPFDESTNYQNPFTTETNPFDEIEE